MQSVWLTLRAGLRHGWRAWLALALVLGVMGGAVLAAAAGARRTDTAYPRLLTWARASDLQVLPNNTGLHGYYRALRAIPQIADMSTGILLNFAIVVHGHYVPANHVSVYASPDGRLGVTTDRVKVLAGRLLDPANPRSIVINQQLAADEHVVPGGTVRLLGIPNDRHGNPLLSRAFPVSFRVAGIVVFDNQIVPAVTGAYPTLCSARRSCVPPSRAGSPTPATRRSSASGPVSAQRRFCGRPAHWRRATRRPAVGSRTSRWLVRSPRPSGRSTRKLRRSRFSQPWPRSSPWRSSASCSAAR